MNIKLIVTPRHNCHVFHRLKKGRDLHAHELLLVDHIRLIQDHPDLLLMTLQRMDSSLEFVRDIQLVGVKQQQDQICPLCEPLNHRSVVVSTITLLVARQNTGSINNSEILEDRGGGLGDLEAREEGLSEFIEALEGEG